MTHATARKIGEPGIVVGWVACSAMVFEGVMLRGRGASPARATSAACLCRPRMHLLIALVLGASPELGAPLLLTSGWQAVLEVPDVRAVVVDDPHVVAYS